MSQGNTSETEFDLIEVDPSALLPPRSRLAPLKPLGLGTPYRESLSSFLQRLADQHGLSPKVLARELVLPRLGINRREQASQADRLWRTSFFNGMGKVPQKWVKILEELTSVKRLDLLTLLPLQSKVGMPGISSPTRRWCPICLHEGAEEGIPYGQLLWEIGIVTACPKHHIKLVNSCDCDPAKAHSSLKSKHLPQLCGLCGNSLALRPGIPVEAASEAELHRATLVAELLGSNLFEPNGCTSHGAGIVPFLQVAVLIVGDECAARTARILGVSKGTLSGWLNYHHLPSLAHAVSIAEVFKVPIAKILVGEGSGDFSSLRPKELQRISHRRRLRRNCSKDELERKLQEILNAEIPVSGREAARITGNSNRGHYLSFPELSRAIAKRSLDQQHKDAQKRREEGLLLIRDTAMQLANEGFIPTRKRLEERIKGVSTFFLSNERDECRRICVEVREEILFPKRSSC